MKATTISTGMPEQRTLWQRIAAHDFEPPHTLNFTARLARDRDWTPGFARGAVEEYRRFCFLAVTASEPMTPSEEVDEVWHLHLTYTRDYWEQWCRVALGAPLHHDPTVGGPAEQARYRTQYAATLARYEAVFGPSDPAYWPATHLRFGRTPRYRNYDGDRWIRLPRPRAPRLPGFSLSRLLTVSR